MAKTKEIIPVKLIIGVMYKDDFNSIVDKLKGLFGEVDSVSDDYDFSFTNYYEKEMGAGLKKRILSFKKLIDREELAAIKHKTNEIEGNLCLEIFYTSCLNIKTKTITSICSHFVIDLNTATFPSIIHKSL